MSIKSTIIGTVARKQRGVRAKAGDRFLRGGRYVVVTKSGGGRLDWEDVSTGDEESGTPTDFRGRALLRVRAPVSLDVSRVELAWSVAGSRRMEMAQRANILRQIKRGGSAEEKAIIDAWILALMAGVEPQRKKDRDR